MRDHTTHPRRAAPTITPEMNSQFHELGYLVVDDLFDVDTDLAPVGTRGPVEI
jgi:hypothetical protein